MYEITRIERDHAEIRLWDTIAAADARAALTCLAQRQALGIPLLIDLSALQPCVAHTLELLRTLALDITRPGRIAFIVQRLADAGRMYQLLHAVGLTTNSEVFMSRHDACAWLGCRPSLP